MDVTARKGDGPLQQLISIGSHTLVSDVSPQLGGENSGPEPHDILAAALAACTTLTVTLYARRKGMDLQDVQLRIEHGDKDGAYVFTNHIRFIGNLDAAELKRLGEIAERCPVHRTLSGSIKIVTELDPA